MQQNDIAIVSNRHLPVLHALMCCIGLQEKWCGGAQTRMRMRMQSDEGCCCAPHAWTGKGGMPHERETPTASAALPWQKETKFCDKILKSTRENVMSVALKSRRVTATCMGHEVVRRNEKCRRGKREGENDELQWNWNSAACSKQRIKLQLHLQLQRSARALCPR
jgi:hypothetical protein